MLHAVYGVSVAAYTRFLTLIFAAAFSPSAMCDERAALWGGRAAAADIFACGAPPGYAGAVPAAVFAQRLERMSRRFARAELTLTQWLAAVAETTALSPAAAREAIAAVCNVSPAVCEEDTASDDFTPQSALPTTSTARFLILPSAAGGDVDTQPLAAAISTTWGVPLLHPPALAAAAALAASGQLAAALATLSPPPPRCRRRRARGPAPPPEGGVEDRRRV